MKNTLSALIFIVLFSSCTSFYQPNMLPAHMMKEKHELRITTNVNNIQGAFAVNEKFFLLANGHFHAGNFDNANTAFFDTTRYSLRSLFGEAGMGYYKNIYEDVMFEISGGVGTGKVTINQRDQFNYRTNSFPYVANPLRGFIQPSIGITNDKIDFIFSTRVSLLQYKNVNTADLTDQDLRYLNIYNIDRPMYVFMEPGITFRAGHQFIKFHTQMFYSYNIMDENLSTRHFNFNMGIHLNFAKRFFKKE